MATPSTTISNYVKRTDALPIYNKRFQWRYRKMAHRQARRKIAAGAEYQSPELAGPVVKFGTSFGISAIFLASAIP
jgi:predicted O-methyltransferase YrrM